jgi:hypothetical protein
MLCKRPISPEETEREFPHVVEMLVPEEGFASKLIAIRQFHTLRGIEARPGRSRCESGRDYIRWCFADPGVAAEFADEFGGTIGEQHSS